MRTWAILLTLSVLAVLLFCPMVSAEKFVGDESNSVLSFNVWTSSDYYQYSYGYSRAYPSQDLGQYPDPISATYAYNQNNLQNSNSFINYAMSSPASYQYITPQYNYQNDLTMRTREELANPQQYQYITPQYNQNGVTMMTTQEIQNPQQYQYITPTSPNVHCYKANPDAAEVCSSS